MKRLLKNTFIIYISIIHFNCNGQTEQLKSKELIEGIVESIKTHYYDEEAGIKFANNLLKIKEDGGFEGLSQDDLISKINIEIHSIKNDRHIQVVNGKGNLKLPWKQSFIREVKFLAGNIGYLQISHFPKPTDEVLDQLNMSLSILKDTQGLIIDIQNNRGGHPDLVSHLLGYFSKDEVTYEVFYEPRADKKYEYKTRKKKHSNFYNKPLTVLVNENTGSVSELFAFAVQNLNVGKVYGTQTLGVVNLAEYVPLSNGYYLLISKGIQQNPISSQSLEGNGVTPDVISEAPLTTGHLKMVHEIHGEVFEKWLSRTEPVSLNEDLLMSYTGSYGFIDISFEDSDLYYQDHSGFRYKLIPIHESTFSLRTSTDERFRLIFDMKSNVLNKVYFNGNIVSYQKISN